MPCLTRHVRTNSSQCGEMFPQNCSTTARSVAACSLPATGTALKLSLLWSSSASNSDPLQLSVRNRTPECLTSTVKIRYRVVSCSASNATASGFKACIKSKCCTAVTQVSCANPFTSRPNKASAVAHRTAAFALATLAASDSTLGTQYIDAAVKAASALHSF